ncbi:MAG TPA: ABC transporter permease [Stellaceae bacterium]|jgi:osmoprotectant transport system permease protein|nr:ABC transporter permease [Stellaceae bacterium]
MTRTLKTPALWVGLLFAFLLLDMPALRPLFAVSFPAVTPEIFDRAGFGELFLSHLGLVAASSVAATFVGMALAIFVTRPAGRDFRTTANMLAIIDQVFPPAAVLALAVPALGFGPKPTIVALFLYGLLPILENAIAGIENVPTALREAGRGMGLSPYQLLRDVELPLAAPVILAGVRVSVTIGIGTATIGSTVGALTFGTPIFDGLAGNKLPYVLQGAVLVALFAIVTDLLFGLLARRLRPPGS